MSFISELLAKFHRTATNKPQGSGEMQNGAPTPRPNKNVYDEARNCFR